MLHITIIPNFKLGTIFRQRVSDSAEGWFGLTQPYLPRYIHYAWLIVFPPIGLRRIAFSGNPAAVNENSRPIKKKRSPQMIAILVAVILVPQGDLILEVIFTSDFHRPPFHICNGISSFLAQIQ